MMQFNDNDLIKIIANALSISVDEVDEDSNSDNIAEWDSLGHLSILSSLDEQTNGKTSDIEGLSEMDSFKKLREILIKEGMIDEGKNNWFKLPVRKK